MPSASPVNGRIIQDSNLFTFNLTMMKEYRFEAIIKSSETGKGGAFVEFPFDVEKEFGTKGRVLVIASFEGVEYRGSLMKMGTTCHMIGVLKEVKQKTGKDIGNVIFAFVFLFLHSPGFPIFAQRPDCGFTKTFHSQRHARFHTRRDGA